ncbi:MAG: 8-amino-7-oxononanoate synthase [Gammaproteobacteria bacterium]
MNNEALLDDIKQHHLYRIRKEITQRECVYKQIGGKNYLSFCSNDYLGLSQEQQVIHAFKQGVEQYGVGSGASAMVSGYTTAHRQLEEQFAAFLQRDKALLFANGYMANLGVMQVFADKHTMIFQDKLNHASLLDAAKLSGAKLKRYRHLDWQHVDSLLSRETVKNKIIAVEGVYSMEGDVSPLVELADIAAQSNALLMVDDAHGIGILGANGGGCCEHFSLSQTKVPLLICPLGKAFGGSGAIVAGDSQLIELLLQRARTYIYTTNIAPGMAVALQTSLQIIQNEAWRREKLNQNINYFNEAANKRGLSLANTNTPIKTFIIGKAETACLVSQILLEKGILVLPIRPPSVPTNTARLRITLNVYHENTDIDFLLDSLQEVYKHALP